MKLVIVSILLFLPSYDAYGMKCDTNEGEVFFEMQEEVFEVFNLDIRVGGGGTSNVYFSFAPHRIRLIDGSVVEKGSPILVKAPLTPIEYRFLKNEADIIRQLQYKGDLFVSAAFDRRGALIMPYRKTRLNTLNKFLDRTNPKAPAALTREQKFQIKEQLNEALIVLGEKGIVHSDLKPENILVEIVNGRAEITIIDFGISAREGRYPLEGSNDRGGTTTYASPEQLQNRPATHRDDAYAVKMILQDLGI